MLDLRRGFAPSAKWMDLGLGAEKGHGLSFDQAPIEIQSVWTDLCRESSLRAYSSRNMTLML